MTEVPQLDLSHRLPTPDEVEKALEAASALSSATAGRGSLLIGARGGNTMVELPPAVGRLILDLLMHVGRGEAVTLVPFGAELTTQQAADMLNISRPFLIKLLETGALRHHKVGTHRRIKAADLIRYRLRRERRQEKALADLARLGQEIDAE